MLYSYCESSSGRATPIYLSFEEHAIDADHAIISGINIHLRGRCIEIQKAYWIGAIR